MIVFAVLAHENDEVLANQVENLRTFNPSCQVVLYNGGNQANLGKKLNIPICPYSRPLQKGRLGHFFLDTMRWLKKTKLSYDFLVNLDSDVMFVRPGFEKFLKGLMRGYDCMGINMLLQHKPDDLPHWYPGQTMWREWERWKPVFQMDYFCGCLNSMQVYRRTIVNRMLAGLDMKLVNKLIAETRVYALEEILYATLAVRCGAKHRSYPYESVEYVRLDVPIRVEEVRQAQLNPNIYFVHPVLREMSDATRQWITFRHV